MTLLVQSCKRGVFLSIFSNRISPSLMESFATNLIASHLKMEWADFHHNSQKKCQLAPVLLLELLFFFFLFPFMWTCSSLLDFTYNKSDQRKQPWSETWYSLLFSNRKQLKETTLLKNLLPWSSSLCFSLWSVLFLVKVSSGYYCVAVSLAILLETMTPMTIHSYSFLCAENSYHS